MAHKNVQLVEQLKSILVKEDMTEMNKLINGGWQILHAFPHPKGGIFILKRM